jgi:DNA-directed RNA polymerase specialized sigma24 family protein
VLRTKRGETREIRSNIKLRGIIQHDSVLYSQTGVPRPCHDQRASVLEIAPSATVFGISSWYEAGTKVLQVLEQLRGLKTNPKPSPHIQINRFAAAKRWVPMHPSRETKPGPQFLLNSVDRFGRQIAPAVLSVSMEIGPRALAYAQNLIGDPALAMNYFEEAAASVSSAIEEKKASGAPPVLNVAAYLFRTFIRMVDDAKHKEKILQESLKESVEARIPLPEEAQVEAAVLLNEVMATCDRASREVVVLRLEGFSWKEIGRQFDISSHAAEARFSKALDHARKVFNIRRRKG